MYTGCKVNWRKNLFFLWLFPSQYVIHWCILLFVISWNFNELHYVLGTRTTVAVAMIEFGCSFLAVFGILQSVTGHNCNLYDVTKSPLTSFIVETSLECGFHCGMSSDCENFDLCLDASPSNCTFYKTVSKTNCGSSSSVMCIIYNKVLFLTICLF